MSSGIGREIGRVTVTERLGDPCALSADYIAVRRRDDGIVFIDAEYLTPLTQEQLADLRELLDRAAMPGQAEAGGAVSGRG